MPREGPKQRQEPKKLITEGGKDRKRKKREREEKRQRKRKGAFVVGEEGNMLRSLP